MRISNLIKIKPVILLCYLINTFHVRYQPLVRSSCFGEHLLLVCDVIFPTTNRIISAIYSKSVDDKYDDEERFSGQNYFFIYSI